MWIVAFIKYLGGSVRSMDVSQRNAMLYPLCRQLVGLQVMLAQYENKTQFVSSIFTSCLLK